MEDIKITLVQTPLHWENPEKNRHMLDQKLAAFSPGDTDLIVLPEMFTTGFTMNAAAMAESMEGPTTAWMKHTAKEKKCVVTGSVIIRDKDRFYNRLIWMNPDGLYTCYDKRHLFRMAGEHRTFSAGNNKMIAVLKGWRFCPLICYDLRFPVWSRNRNDYDCLIYIANWPERRSFAWKQLLTARAIENIAYTVGVNCIGKDGKDITYSGDSVVVDCKGEQISHTRPLTDTVETVVLSATTLQEFRNAFPAAMDADVFDIRPDPITS